MVSSSLWLSFKQFSLHPYIVPFASTLSRSLEDSLTCAFTNVLLSPSCFHSRLVVDDKIVLFALDNFSYYFLIVKSQWPTTIGCPPQPPYGRTLSTIAITDWSSSSSRIITGTFVSPAHSAASFRLCPDMISYPSPCGFFLIISGTNTPSFSILHLNSNNSWFRSTLNGWLDKSIMYFQFLQHLVNLFISQMQQLPRP